MPAKIIPARKRLLPYQWRWIDDTSRLKIAQKSRQIGWTWATACGLVRRKCLDTARYDAWISSRDDLQAKLFLEDCKRFATVYQLAAGCLSKDIIDREGHTTHILRLANGRRIHSMSSSPNAQAGKRGDRILDEFALHQDPKLLYSIAYPGITWGGSLEIFSTHRGTHNFFNQLIEEIKHHGNPKGFSFHSVTLQDALEQGFLHKLQQKLPPDDPRQAMDEADYFNFIKSGCPDEETFLQEYMCTPGDDQSAFLSYNLIASCESPPSLISQSDQILHSSLCTLNCSTAPSTSNSTSDSAPPPTLPPTPTLNLTLPHNPNLPPNPQYIGVDLARSHDLTVIYILEKRDDLLHTRDIITFQNQPFAIQEQTLYNLLAPENVLRCCIDQSGLGRQFTERAIERFGSWKVEGITFTPETKEKLAYPVRTAFENRTIRIPQDSLLRSDLRAIRKETTFAGNIRFTADRGKDGHADRFWALALALHAASRPEQTCGIEVVTYDY